MKKRKIMALFLVIVMSVLCFAGCDSSSNDDDRDDDRESMSDYDDDDDDDDDSKDKGEDNSKTEAPVLEDERSVVDPFEGLELVCSGISPFCTVNVNNSKCSKESQECVTYSIPEGYYANGDTVCIIADIIPGYDDKYIINEDNTKKVYTVSDMPYYVTDINSIDISFIVSELKDYVYSEISFEKKYELFGINAWSFLDTYGDSANNWCDFFNVSSVKSKDAYMLSMKETSKKDFISNENPIYNSLRIISTCEAEASHQQSHDMWYAKGDIFVCFILNNVIAYPDGSIGWGDLSPESLEIKYSSTFGGVETSKKVNVTQYMSEYNVVEVDKKDWIKIPQ